MKTPSPSLPHHRVVDFGDTNVSAEEKSRLVNNVFSQVAPYYDRMNDLMSIGLHRCWKNIATLMCEVRPNMRVLDIACGSGDIAARLLPEVAGERAARRRIKNNSRGFVTLCDINPNMLAVAKKRIHHPAARFALSNGETLPFANNSFDRAIICFGLRNITNRQQCLNEMFRVLRPGGMGVIVEFSPPQGKLAHVKRRYLSSILPALGQYFFNDRDSYRYLGESILRFPDRQAIISAMQCAGFSKVSYIDLGGGIALLHRGRKIHL